MEYLGLAENYKQDDFYRNPDSKWQQLPATVPGYEIHINNLLNFPDDHDNNTIGPCCSIRFDLLRERRFSSFSGIASSDPHVIAGIIIPCLTQNSINLKQYLRTVFLFSIKKPPDIFYLGV